MSQYYGGICVSGSRPKASSWKSPLEERALADLLFGERNGVIFDQRYDGNNAIILKHACALGCVSKRLGSHYRSGRSIIG